MTQIRVETDRRDKTYKLHLTFRKMKRGLKLVLFAFVLFSSLSLISADVTVSPISFGTKSIYELNLYNITIVNADTGPSGNITEVKINLPSGLIFNGTSGTNSTSSFSNTSSALSWISTPVINSSTYGDNVKSFWFYANATSLGTFNIAVNTTNSTGTYTSNIQLAVSDSSLPTITLVSPLANADDTDGVLVFACNATDNLGLSYVGLRIYSNNTELFSNNLNVTGTSAQKEWDYPFGNAGTYKWNCFANDTSSNLVWGTNRTLIVSGIAASCNTNWTFGAWNNCLNGTQTRTVTDRNNCNVTTEKPPTNQSCTSSLCDTDWTCKGWTPIECPQNGTQSRICTDDNSCGDESDKPKDSRTCTPKGGSAWIFVTIILILVLGGGAAAAIFYFRNKNPSEYVPQEGQQNQQNQQQDYGYNYQ